MLLLRLRGSELGLDGRDSESLGDTRTVVGVHLREDYELAFQDVATYSLHVAHQVGDQVLAVLLRHYALVESSWLGVVAIRVSLSMALGSSVDLEIRVLKLQGSGSTCASLLP